MKIVFCSLIVILALAGLAYSRSSEKVLICYVGSWAAYRSNTGKFDADDIDPFLCTHLVFSFLGLADDSSVKSLDSWLTFNANDGGGKDYFNKLNALKRKNPQLKTLLAVGGFEEGSAKYSKMAGDPSRRKTFISSALAMVQKYGFDGLDLDWEYPNQRDSVNGQADVDNLTTLLQELKQEFSRRSLLVTIAVAAAERSASLSYDVVGVSSNVDFVNLMAYDLHGAWDPVTGHNAALYKSMNEFQSANTVDASVQYWLRQGCPPEKLVLGTPFYGHTFTLSNTNSNGVGAAARGKGIQGPYTKEAGYIAYGELCDLFNKQRWNLQYDDQARVPYAVQNLNWISYDDPRSITEKVNYAMKYNLAGAMVWSLECDDFNGVCGERFALLKSINRALGK